MAALSSPLCLSLSLSLSLSSTFSPPATATIPSTSIRFPIRRCQLSLLSVRAAVSAKDTPAPKKPRGIMKPTPITPELQVIVGVPEISRTQALKLVWAYIKQHNLQDPNNKKIILCDEKLKKIFGKEQVGLLEVTKLLNPHFKKKE